MRTTSPTSRTAAAAPFSVVSGDANENTSLNNNGKSDDVNGSSAAASAATVPVAATPTTDNMDNVSTFQVVSVITQFAIASITMIAGNKAAITHFPLPCTLVIIQAIGTVGLLLAFFRSSLGPALTFHTNPALTKEWLPISILFTVMLYTSMKSFVYSGVSTILILRNVGAIVTTVVEYFVRGTTANAATYAWEVVIVIGAVMYTGGAVDASPIGLFWIFFNVCGQVAYGVYLKHKMETSPQLKELSNFAMSFLNNTLSIPLTFVVMFLQGEHAMVAEVVHDATTGTWMLVLLTCVFGFVISTSGFALQKLVSAATFLVINNLTKFVNILIGVFILKDKVVGLNGIGGCLLALGAGVGYSYEQMKLRQQAASGRKGNGSAAK